MKKHWVLSYPLSAQADLSLRWEHRSLCWFCHEAAYLFIYLFERVSEKMVLKTLQYYNINLYVIKSTFKKRTEVQTFFCLYNEFKIILNMVLKPLMFHTKSMINLMPVAML